jgi:hypothetical protein
MEFVAGEIGAPFQVEGLEQRRMMSAGPFAGTPSKVWEDRGGAVVMLAAAPMARSAPVIVPQVAGAWSGTVKMPYARAPFAVSMQISRQNGVAAMGTFRLGPATAHRAVTSTAVVSGGYQRGFNLIVSQKGLYASVTATVSKNGQQIVGRWACNGPGGWATGTITLNMVLTKRARH